MSGALSCPSCKGMNTKTVDSRSYEKGTGIRRRRECVGCGHRFFTVESIAGNVRIPAKPTDYQRALNLIDQASRILAGQKLRSGNAKITFTAEMDACLKDCHAQGLAARETGDRIGVCYTVVNRRKRELGIKPLKPYAQNRARKSAGADGS